ncbi:MAG: hypothetical protein ACKESA_00600, partial [Candidatus Hodgkinia cicadicola]
IVIVVSGGHLLIIVRSQWYCCVYWHENWFVSQAVILTSFACPVFDGQAIEANVKAVWLFVPMANIIDIEITKAVCLSY